MLVLSKRYLLWMVVFSLTLSGLCETVGAGNRGGAKNAAKKKVLYFTHEPGRYHKYTPQLAIFREIAQKADWELTVMTGEHKSQIEKLRTPDFGKGFDAIVYNFCFAQSRDLEACANVMTQTREHGVPCLLIHCSMHSWWATYKNGKPGAIGPKYTGKAKADPKLVEQWRIAHPKADKPFPAWGDFTGIASTSHGRKAPIKMNKKARHPATSRFPDGFTTGNTELYNNVYVLDKVAPLIEGVQGKNKFIVMWTCPQGKSQVMGLTVGHDVADWTTESYRNLIVDGVNYLIDSP